MPTAMAIQFIITLNANRLVLAIGLYTRKLHDTTALFRQFPAIPIVVISFLTTTSVGKATPYLPPGMRYHEETWSPWLNPASCTRP
jgi:hypothetical protein